MAVKTYTVIIAGGGTGGHISPGIALYEELKERGVRAFFLAEKSDVRFSTLKEVARDDLLLYRTSTITKNLLKLPYFVVSFSLALLKAMRIISKNSVDAVVGMGGYVSAPILLAARLKKVPLFLCEQNSVPGRVTRRFEKTCRRIYGTFEVSSEYLKFKEKYVHAGNPIRKNVLKNVSREEARKAFHLSHSKKVVLVIGGSQGALNINELIFGLKREYPDGFKNVGVIWSAGSYSYEKFKDRMHHEIDEGSVYLSSFIDRVGHAYCASDIAISRSGAGVMMELAAMGLPSIQIPYPYAADQHQDKNADAFEKKGAAVKILDKDAVPEKVAPVLFGLLNDPRSLKKMSDSARAMAKSDAAKTIADDILNGLK